MSLYVYCPVGSTGAALVAKEAGAKRVKALPKTKKGDTIIFWGASLVGDFDEVKTLNNVPRVTKQKELSLLEKGGVSVPAFSLTPREGYVARRADHQGGKDLLSGRKKGDFYVEKLDLKREFRVHIWRGQSIRLGMKMPREGVPQHPWVRSYDGGWKISYGKEAQQSVSPGVREAAKKAVSVLGLDFGAVDLGVTTSGKIVVLEVNRRPGAEGKTALTYGKLIKEEAA